MKIHIECYDLDGLKEIESVLFAQEFDEQPCYEGFVVEVGEKRFDYTLRQEFNKWYIVTE